jgi:hypothetical protein
MRGSLRIHEPQPGRGPPNSSVGGPTRWVIGDGSLIVVVVSRTGAFIASLWT